MNQLETDANLSCRPLLVLQTQWGYGVNNARHVSIYLPEFLINKEPLTIPCYIDKG